jgi:hypothetical protein
MPLTAPRSLVALLVAAAFVSVVAVTACGGTAPDANEPNDELGAATSLTAGTAVDGALGDEDDADLFACEAPVGEAEPRPFRVTVRTDSVDDLKVDVGASIPGAMEGISWPGWDAVAGDGRITVEGALAEGTVLIVLTGEPGTAYSVGIDWE